MTPLRRGQLVMVEFSDHVQGGSGAWRFVVYGKLVGLKRTELVIDSWHYQQKRKHDANQTRFTIVRSAVHRIVRLRKDEVVFGAK
jgi:hypothetical protein